MKILELKTMRGPNYWSLRHKKIIVMKLDLEALGREPTHRIAGFAERLRALMPGLASHRCSPGHEGGFFEVVEQGTWMGHVVMHIALELQSLAGMECTFARHGSAPVQGVYDVIFEYQVPEAGQLAAHSAVKIAAALARGESCNLDEEVQALRRIAESARPGPSTSSIVEEAARRGIPVRRINDTSLYILGYGNRQKKIRATVAGTTSGVAIGIAKDKQETKLVLEKALIPVPKGLPVNSREEVKVALKKVRYPLVVKPIDGNHGRGITTGITSEGEALAAFDLAAELSLPVLLEENVKGHDHRLLVIGYRFVAAARRTPAMVTGDGTSSIRELVDLVNADPRRGEGHENVLTKIEIDSATLDLLAERGLNVDAVPEKGVTVYLKQTANISTGGTSEDVTDIVHPDTIAMAERAARLVGLDICGLDVVAADITKPLTRENGAVVEVNAGPGLRMHLSPSMGQPRNIARPIIDMLFPRGETGRIPIVAVTGTNGKTTTTRLIAHLAAEAGGRRVGYTTTDGIYINGELVYEGDCTGPVSAETVLFDPGVDFAVLECARGGILRAGLAFDSCDISVVTNVSADHLGLKDIHTIEDMAKVKQVLPETTARNGFAILNADDDLVFAMGRATEARIALFSLNHDNPRIKEHCDQDGYAAVVEDGWLTICAGRWRSRLGKLDEFPITLGGRAEAMIRNLLPAALAAVLCGFDEKAIGSALRRFDLSPSRTPGRMNIFRFPGFEVMVDYAHNPHGMQALKKFIDSTDAEWKTGVIGIAGDRRDEDLREMGAIAATMFDEIIIRHDVDMRGRPKDEMTTLLMEGIRSEDQEMPVHVISEELRAVEYAVNHARTNGFVTICSEKVKDTLSFLEDMLAEYRPTAAEPGAGQRRPPVKTPFP
jgi:cyanophycin synthetase